MYQKILVPLDGSVAAEEAIPYAGTAPPLRGTLTLVRVVPSAVRATCPVQHDRCRNMAQLPTPDAGRGKLYLAEVRPGRRLQRPILST